MGKKKDKPLETIKIGRINYTIYHNCDAKLVDGHWVMVNRFTGSHMIWETGAKKIRAV